MTQDTSTTCGGDCSSCNTLAPGVIAHEDGVLEVQQAVIVMPGLARQPAFHIADGAEIVPPNAAALLVAAGIDPALSGTLFQRTAMWLSAAGKEVGNAENLSVQIGVHLTEMAEFLKELTVISTTGLSHATMQELHEILHAVGTNAAKGHITIEISDREMALDALCDCDVTGNGVAYLAGMRKDEGDIRTIASNFSKFREDGTALILEGGKVGKNPSTYVKTDLSDLV